VWKTTGSKINEMIKKVMHYMFLSCLKATDLINKKSDAPLSCVQNIQLKAHKSMCKACNNYEKQSSFLDKALITTLNKEELTVDIDALKACIQAKIKIR
jgi:hypothetical protein